MNALNEKEYKELVRLLKDESQRLSHRVHLLKCKATATQIYVAYKEAGVEQELSRYDTDLQDTVDNLIFDLFRELAKPYEDDIDWSISDISAIRDIIIDVVTVKTPKTEYSIYPYIAMFADEI